MSYTMIFFIIRVYSVDAKNVNAMYFIAACVCVCVCVMLKSELVGKNAARVLGESKIVRTDII